MKGECFIQVTIIVDAPSVRILVGIDYFVTYCTVPSARSNFKDGKAWINSLQYSTVHVSVATLVEWGQVRPRHCSLPCTVSRRLLSVRRWCGVSRRRQRGQCMGLHPRRLMFATGANQLRVGAPINRLAGKRRGPRIGGSDVTHRARRPATLRKSLVLIPV